MKLLIISLILIVSSFLIFSSVTPKITPLENNFSPQESPEFSFWMVDFDMKRAISSYSKNQKEMKFIMPLVFVLSEDLKIKETNLDIDNIFQSKNSEVRVLATLTNNLDAARINKLLEDKNSWESVIPQVINLLSKQDYYGLDLDFENISRENTDAFSEFVKMLHAKLIEKGYYFSVTVQAQKGEGVNFGQDLGALAKVADEIRVMAYDVHTTETKAGSIIPKKDLESIIKYNLKFVPVGKLNLALPTYGYDWAQESAHSLQYEDIILLLNKFPNSGVVFDEITGSAYLKYKINSAEHVVWFEDKKSLETKINMAKEYGINKFSFWRIGGEAESIWGIIRE